MTAESGLSTTFDKVLSIDFAEQFGQKLKTLTELLGIQRVIPMPAGSSIKTYTSSVTLDGTVVGKGDIIPLSEVELAEGTPITLTWDKKRKAVAMEDIQAYGFDTALTRTDNKLLSEIQKGVRTKLLAQLATGTTSTRAEDLQAAMAQNWAAVTAKFDEDDVEVISFINPYDAGNYLASANVTIQTAFGMTYLEGFMNNRVVFMSAQIPDGTVYSTAADNLVAAYAKMGGGEIAKAFDFVTDSTGIIGVTHDINKQRLQAETITAYGLELFAERLDGVVICTIQPEVTYTAVADGAAGETTSTKITLTFSETVTGLKATDITLVNGTGKATKGDLTAGADNTYVLTISAVTEGTVVVTVKDIKGYNFTTPSVTVDVFKEEA